MKKVIYHEKNIIEVILENEHIKVHLINIGASLFKLYYNDVDVLVGPKELKDYVKPDHYYGKTIGRFSGRLPINFYKEGLNEINLKPYKGESSTIHGGANGFSTKAFNYIETTDNEALFKLVQKESDDNLPGDIFLTVKYELNGSNLKVSYDATTTKTTILNITNHSYFNLDGSETITEHDLKISTDKYVLFDEEYNILGLKEVKGTIYDFSEYQKLKNPLDKLKDTAFKGLDTIFMLKNTNETNLYSPKNKTNLQITTNYPAIVVYTHNAASPDGLDYFNLWPFAGVALECEYEPGGTLTNFLSDAVLKKEDTYNHFVNYMFTKK